jgi:hypothetical protein
MSACAVLVIRVLALSFVLGRSLLRTSLLRISLLCIRGSRIGRLSIRGLSARPPLWREFSAHERPRADEKGDTDNRRRGERGEILQHEGYLDLLASRGQPVAVTAIALYPRGPCGPTRPWLRHGHQDRRRAGRDPTARHGVRAGVGSKQAAGKQQASGKENAYKRSSMRVFPSVFGLTRSRSRNSATPSS